MQDPKIARQKTALKRYNFSRPINAAIIDGLINPSKTLFDYGCGHGDDLKLLKKSGIQSSGWDPELRSSAPIQPADIVNLGYVVNVIENRQERETTLQKAWDLARELLIVSAQLTIDAKTENFSPFKDGYVTKRGTFQKYFEQQELRQWLDQVLSEGAIAAAPGIFYIFRDHDAKEAFISSRYRRRASVPRLRKSDELFEKYSDLLQSLMDFISSRGRIPDRYETDEAPEIIDKFGSIKKAFRIIRLVTDNEQWERITEERSQDLLIYLALSRFDGRKKFSRLPRELQLDVKAFFSTYKRAWELADSLLFGCGNQDLINECCTQSGIGKLTPTALYIHRSALEDLAPLLRTYEGCARSYLGLIEGTNLVKLHRKKPKISYLSYPDFRTDHHPRLEFSLTANLQTFKIRRYHYEKSENPPILHRKELFISETNEQHGKFARLTRSEERAGLYDHTSNIGRVNEWEDLLREKGVYLKGHRLLRIKSQF